MPYSEILFPLILISVSSILDEYRRIQSIYFRARYGYSTSEIARIVGLKPQTVRNMHSFYLKERPLFK